MLAGMASWCQAHSGAAGPDRGIEVGLVPHSLITRGQGQAQVGYMA